MEEEKHEGGGRGVDTARRSQEGGDRGGEAGSKSEKRKRNRKERDEVNQGGGVANG